MIQQSPKWLLVKYEGLCGAYIYIYIKFINGGMYLVLNLTQSYHGIRYTNDSYSMLLRQQAVVFN